MNEEFLATIKYSTYTKDFWLFEDEYIKEVEYKDDKISTNIIEITEFINDHPNHEILDKLKEYKEI
jgi:hypothetical protein